MWSPVRIRRGHDTTHESTAYAGLDHETVSAWLFRSGVFGFIIVSSCGSEED